MSDKWYITTGVRTMNGSVLQGYGPWNTREQALEARARLEATTTATYWVENLPNWPKSAHPDQQGRER